MEGKKGAAKPYRRVNGKLSKTNRLFWFVLCVLASSAFARIIGFHIDSREFSIRTHTTWLNQANWAIIIWLRLVQQHCTPVNASNHLYARFDLPFRMASVPIIISLLTKLLRIEMANIKAQKLKENGLIRFRFLGFLWRGEHRTFFGNCSQKSLTLNEFTSWEAIHWYFWTFPPRSVYGRLFIILCLIWFH